MQAYLMQGATATRTGAAFADKNNKPDRTYQATVSGVGAVSATIIIEGSNEDASVNVQNYLTIGTITLSGTTIASDGFASSAAWVYVRARMTAISGTGAAVNVSMGY